MSGTVTVAAPSPGPQPGPGRRRSPARSPGPSQARAASPRRPRAAAGAVQVRTLEPAAARFCARRGPGCRRPGVRLRIDLSAPARVTGVLRRRAKRFGRVDFGTVAAGPQTLRFRRTAAGERLVPGRYSLAVRVDGDAREDARVPRPLAARDGRRAGDAALEYGGLDGRRRTRLRPCGAL